MPGETERLHLRGRRLVRVARPAMPAIDHAIEGRRPSVCTGTAQTATRRSSLEQGRMRMLARWFSAIPEHQLREHPFLQPIALWATCFTHGPWDAMRDASSNRAALDSHHRRGARQRPRAGAAAAGHAGPARRSLRGRPPEPGAPAHRPALADSVLLNAMAHILAVRGDPHEARRMLEAARERGSSTFNRMYTESLAGLFDLHEGRLRQATARLRMAVDSTHAVSYNHSHGMRRVDRHAQPRAVACRSRPSCRSNSPASDCVYMRLKVLLPRSRAAPPASGAPRGRRAPPGCGPWR